MLQRWQAGGATLGAACSGLAGVLGCGSGRLSLLCVFIINCPEAYTGATLLPAARPARPGQAESAAAQRGSGSGRRRTGRAANPEAPIRMRIALRRCTLHRALAQRRCLNHRATAHRCQAIAQLSAVASSDPSHQASD